MENTRMKNKYRILVKHRAAGKKREIITRFPKMLNLCVANLWKGRFFSLPFTWQKYDRFELNDFYAKWSEYECITRKLVEICSATIWCHPAVLLMGKRSEKRKNESYRTLSGENILSALNLTHFEQCWPFLYEVMCIKRLYNWWKVGLE